MKSFFKLVFPLLLMAVLVGCKKQADPDTPEKPEISFWTTESYHKEEREYLRQLARQFEENTGTKVKIEFLHWDDVVTKYLAATGAGNPPNIGQHGPDLALRFGQEGKIVPVDDLIADLGKDRFFPEFLDQACLYKDHYWSVPWFIEVRSLLIRKDWLEDLKLTPPETWEEWLEMCKAMTRDMDGDGSPDRWGYALYGRDKYGHTWTGLCASNGGGLFDSDGNLALTDPINRDTLQWYCDLYLKYKVTPTGTRSADWMQADNYYVRGDVGSFITSGYILRELKDKAPEILKNSMYVPIPVPRKGAKSVSYLGGSHLMLFKDVPHADKAKEFLKFLMSGEQYLGFLKSTGSGTLPVFNDVAEDPYFADDQHRKVLVKQIHGAVRHGYRGDPQPIVGALEGEGVFGMALKLLITGQESTAEEALEKAQRTGEKVIARQAIGKKD